MYFSYRPSGCCASTINFDIDENNKVTKVSFERACPGNTLAISKLVDGQSAEWIIEKLKGNPCGGRPSSCADQFARGLELALARMKEQAQA